MKRFFLFAAMFIAIAATASAQNGATTDKDAGCTYWPNYCCGEYVEICYNIHVVYEKNGIKLQAKGKGTGTVTGNSYNFSYSQNLQYTSNEQGQVSYTYKQTDKLNSLGNTDCGQSITYTYKITINANGEVTVEIINVEFDCPNLG